MRSAAWRLRNRVWSMARPGEQTTVTPEPQSEEASPVDLGLDHLTAGQRIGLRDDSMAGFFNNETGELFRGFPLGGDDLLVDVGCGGGGPLGFASRHAGRIVAIDVTEEAVATARETIRDTGADLDRCEFIVASAEDIPLPSEHASRVMCMEVLEHVDDPAVAMSELVRIGKPGALYLISVPDERSERLTKLYAPKKAFEKPHHIRMFDTGSFRELVAAAGLQILSHDFNGFYKAVWMLMFWVNFERMAEESPDTLPTTFTEDDPLLQQWSRTWDGMLDTPMGAATKTLLDSILPKSQIIVARKPLGNQ